MKKKVYAKVCPICKKKMRIITIYSKGEGYEEIWKCKCGYYDGT